MDMLLPIWIMVLVESVDPRWKASSTLNWEPMIVRENTLMQLPAVAIHLTEMLLAKLP
jgi:hypothetical protein